MIQKGSLQLNSSIIKALLFEHYRFHRQMLGALTEVYAMGNNYEDFVAFKRNEITAVEIKISKSDFLADFKKKKYFSTKPFRFHKFYFCVPQSLESFVREYLAQADVNVRDKSKYGLLVIDNDLNVITSKNAQLLRQRENIFAIDKNAEHWNKNSFVLENFAYYLIQRMSSELTLIKMKEFKNLIKCEAKNK